MNIRDVGKGLYPRNSMSISLHLVPFELEKNLVIVDIGNSWKDHGCQLDIGRTWIKAGSSTEWWLRQMFMRRGGYQVNSRELVVSTLFTLTWMFGYGGVVIMGLGGCNVNSRELLAHCMFGRGVERNMLEGDLKTGPLDISTSPFGVLVLQIIVPKEPSYHSLSRFKP